MKTITFFPLAILILFSPACSQKKQTNLNGVYVVGSIGKNPEVSWASIEENKLMDFGKAPFNFLDNDTLYIDPKIGMEFFGDSIFHYELTEGKLKLSKKGKNLELPYEDEGVFRLFLTHSSIERLDLIPPKKESQL